MNMAIDQPVEEYIIKAYPMLTQVSEAIASELGITLAQMRSQNHTRTHSMARSIFCAICDGVPLATIGKFINRNHSTVIHHKRRAEDSNITDRNFRQNYNKVLSNYKQRCGVS